MQRLLLEDFLGVAGDHQLLVGSDDQSADLGAPGGDVADIAHGMLVLLGIDEIGRASCRERVSSPV